MTFVRAGALALALVLGSTFEATARADDAAKAEGPPKTRPGLPVATTISWTVGGIALGSFAAFGLKARIDYDDYEALCAPRCAASERDTVQTSVTIADVSLVVAIVAAGVGTFFLLTRPSR